MPDPTPDPDRGLPAEIEAAIHSLVATSRHCGSAAEGASAEQAEQAWMDEEAACATLTAAILSRLTAAEAERTAVVADCDGAEAERDDALARLTAADAEKDKLRTDLEAARVRGEEDNHGA